MAMSCDTGAKYAPCSSIVGTYVLALGNTLAVADVGSTCNDSIVKLGDGGAGVGVVPLAPTLEPSNRV